MLRLIHCADLHLSDRERDYSLGVFEEIIEQASRREAAALLIAGDLFDTYGDAEALRADVRELAGRFTGEILYIPGNHEELQAGRTKSKTKQKSSGAGIGVLDLSPITIIEHTPCTFLERMWDGVAVEILAVPHQNEYGDYRTWNVPEKRAPLRLAMAHGIVTGLAYTGPDEEAGAGMLDPMLFAHHSVDYAALGHIHAKRLERQHGTICCYPGSARVWRSGERDKRGFALINYDPRTQVLQPEFVALESAGVYREVPIALGLNTDTVELTDADRWGENDFIELRLSGLVEDERLVNDIIGKIELRYADRVRRLEIRRDDVDVLPGISSEPLARKFLELWAKREPVIQDGQNYDEKKHAHERAVWFRARELALLEIKRLLDSRR